MQIRKEIDPPRLFDGFTSQKSTPPKRGIFKTLYKNPLLGGVDFG
jgi:hypothetical protein